MAELHQVQVEIWPKKKIITVGSVRTGRVGRVGSARWMDNLEIRLNSAQLELELG